MIYAVVLGIALAVSGASAMTAAMLIVPLIAAHAIWEISFLKLPITRSDSPFALYVQNLQAQGDTGSRAWVGYLLQSCIFWIPVAFIAYFAVAYFRSA
jgi:hypothetical protein